ncbi:INO80 complex subunit B [Drosophila nasuta]|uniref:INO80 complex subunit B n=1 Tax=Drosophila nasuta TaxID=42062 RepID=UPI00295EE448|nr:INO80 complex subunit B [Drosophila nasuta]
MGKTEDRRSKRSKRQKPARFASPTESASSPVPTNVASEVEIEIATTTQITSTTPTHVKAVVSATPTPSITKAIESEPPTQRVRPASSTKTSPHVLPAAGNANAKKAKKRRNSDTSSDEERWLNAIETGKLEDVDDELKKIKDPKLMTARQRAMYERSQDAEPALSGFVEELIALPSGYREKEKPQTAEDIQKAALKSQKRKQQADERREKDKQKTMERLLKKQESGKQRAAARQKNQQKLSLPSLTYMNTLEGAYIMVPPGQEFPLQAQVADPPPRIQLCGIAGCGKRKIYSCSKTNMPLCSLACYRKNLVVAQI